MSIKRQIPGFVFVLGIALCSYILSTINASFDALVISILAGMIAGNVFARQRVFLEGIEGTYNTLLPAGIALYGTQLTFSQIHGSEIFLILIVFLLLFVLTLLISRVFNIKGKVPVLLASGMAVCGATAIAVIAPLIGARREDTSIAIISVMMLGLTGMIFYPIINDAFSLTNNEFNFLAGSTLPMLGQVRVAAENVCPSCPDQAVRIKLIRISFLLLVVTAAAFLSGKKEKRVSVPWFVFVFIFLAALANSTPLLRPYLARLSVASSFCLSAGLAAIGYSVDFDAVMEEGLTPLATLFLSWGGVLLILYLARGAF